MRIFLRHPRAIELYVSVAAQRRMEERLEAMLLEVAWRADVVDGQPRGRRELGRAECGEAWSQ